MNACLKCGNPTKTKFCGRSCANSYNNRVSPKRKPEHKCLDCGKLINAQRARCREHYLEWLKIKEVKEKIKYSGKIAKETIRMYELAKGCNFLIEEKVLAKIKSI